MSAPSTVYFNGRFRYPRLNQANNLVRANFDKVQMIANRCLRYVDNLPPPSERLAC